MPAPSTTVSVHTADAAPDAPPYRLSRVAGHDAASVTVSVANGQGAGDTAVEAGGLILGDSALPGMTPYIAAIKVVTGATRDAGVVARFGAVCGRCRCGTAKPLHIEPAGSVAVTVPAAALPAGDGDKTVTVWTLVEPEGWT